MDKNMKAKANTKTKPSVVKLMTIKKSEITYAKPGDLPTKNPPSKPPTADPAALREELKELQRLHGRMKFVFNNHTGVKPTAELKMVSHKQNTLNFNSVIQKFKASTLTQDMQQFINEPVEYRLRDKNFNPFPEVFRSKKQLQQNVNDIDYYQNVHLKLTYKEKQPFIHKDMQADVRNTDKDNDIDYLIRLHLYQAIVKKDKSAKITLTLNKPIRIFTEFIHAEEKTSKTLYTICTQTWLNDRFEHHCQNFTQIVAHNQFKQYRQTAHVPPNVTVDFSTEFGYNKGIYDAAGGKGGPQAPPHKMTIKVCSAMKNGANIGQRQHEYYIKQEKLNQSTYVYKTERPAKIESFQKAKYEGQNAQPHGSKPLIIKNKPMNILLPITTLVVKHLNSTKTVSKNFVDLQVQQHITDKGFPLQQKMLTKFQHSFKYDVSKSLADGGTQTYTLEENLKHRIDRGINWVNYWNELIGSKKSNRVDCMLPQQVPGYVCCTKTIKYEEEEKKQITRIVENVINDYEKEAKVLEDYIGMEDKNKIQFQNNQEHVNLDQLTLMEEYLNNA